MAEVSSSDTRYKPVPIQIQPPPPEVATKLEDIKMDAEPEYYTDDGSDESPGDSSEAIGTGCPVDEVDRNLYCTVDIDNCPMDGWYVATINNGDLLCLERGIQIFLKIHSEDILHLSKSTLIIFSKKYVARLTCRGPEEARILNEALMNLQRRLQLCPALFTNQAYCPVSYDQQNTNANMIQRPPEMCNDDPNTMTMENLGNYMTAFLFNLNNQQAAAAAASQITSGNHNNTGQTPGSEQIGKPQISINFYVKGSELNKVEGTSTSSNRSNPGPSRKCRPLKMPAKSDRIPTVRRVRTRREIVKSREYRGRIVRARNLVQKLENDRRFYSRRSRSKKSHKENASRLFKVRAIPERRTTHF